MRAPRQVEPLSGWRRWAAFAPLMGLTAYVVWGSLGGVSAVSRSPGSKPKPARAHIRRPSHAGVGVIDLDPPEPRRLPSLVRDRSGPLTGWRLRLAFIPLAGFTAYVVWADLGWANTSVWAMVVFYTVVATMTLAIMTSGLFWRSFTHLPVAPGRVIALVPVYNESDEHVRETVLAIAAQTYPPDEIHVMDDGSATPLATFDCPTVRWHRQSNQGKRHAQGNILRTFAADEWDFIFTVDSDSVVDPDALEHLLRSMSNPKVMAATGMIFTRNWRENIVTRMVDINIVSSCLMFRMIRSWLGIVTPTSGALALYRADLVYDNLEDYVTSGTAGDDRRLSFYALLRGEVVGVHESVVETHLPTTIGDNFRQRLRWSKSAWLGIPFVITYLRPLALTFYMYPMVFAVMWPFMVGLLITMVFTIGSPAVVYGLLYWEVVSISMTTIYAIYRPCFRLRDRVSMWLLSPFYPLFGLIVLRPAQYWALTKLRSTSWHTRD